MRNNGLQAASWTSLAEVDPQIADAILALLADAGVAAYAVPSQGTVGGYLDVTPPSRPTEKVYVDSEAKKRAYEVVVANQGVLEAELSTTEPVDAPAQTAAPAPAPSPAAPDEDVWRDLVDRIKSSPALPTRPETPIDAVEPQGQKPGADEWSEFGGQEEREQHHPELIDDPDDHFVPPEPPPLPESDQLTRWAWVGLLGGPGFLVLMTLLGWPLDGWMVALAVVGFVVGFGILVVRMKDRPHVDDDPDAGAVV